MKDFLSGHNSVLFGLVSPLIGGLVVAVVLIWVLAARPGLIKIVPPASIAGSGYQHLTEHHCRFGQTRHMRIRGQDDNFAFGEPELTRAPDHLKAYPGLLSNSSQQRNYDETGPDLQFSDWVELPKNIVSGTLAIRLQTRDDFIEDFISIGDLSAQDAENEFWNGYAFHSRLRDLERREGWTHHGNGLFTVRLSDLNFRWNEDDVYETAIADRRKWTSLLPYLAAKPDVERIDILVSDDTAVDFVGLVFCTEPQQPRGVTFAEVSWIARQTDDFQVVSCSPGIREKSCNPFYGDTLCSEEHPLGCYRDTARPAPTEKAAATLNSLAYDRVLRTWGGGDLEFTEPVRGDSFTTLDDAVALCRARFGADWRVLDFHDGGHRHVATYPSESKLLGRFWVDIRDQPKGTCWSRNIATETPLADAAR